MKHTVHPYAHRLGVIRDWKSRWFAKTPREYRQNVMADAAIRRFLKKRLRGHYVTSVELERSEKYIRVLIKTSRPGLVIGRGGEGSTKLPQEIKKICCGPRWVFGFCVSFTVFFAFFCVLATLPNSRDTMLIVRMMRFARPRAIGLKRFKMAPLLTAMLFTKRFSGAKPALRAFATAESNSFDIAGDDFFGRNRSAARADGTDLPRIRSATSLTFRGDW